MGSITEIFNIVVTFFGGLLDTGSAAAENLRYVGSTAAEGSLGVVTDSLGTDN